MITEQDIEAVLLDDQLCSDPIRAAFLTRLITELREARRLLDWARHEVGTRIEICDSGSGTADQWVADLRKFFDGVPL